MSKELELKHFLLENSSFKKIYLNDKESNPDLFITVKGLSLTEIIIDEDILGKLYTDIQHRGNDGKFIMDQMYQNIAKDTYSVVKRCLVDDEDKAILTIDVFNELPTDVINEMILTIIEMTIPSKKKLQSMTNSINRIEKKKDTLMDMPQIQEMMKRLIRT